MQVMKRTGLVEDLSKKKILSSISKANECVDSESRLTQKQLKRIAETVMEHCESMPEGVERIDIDELETIIENKIMEATGYEVAKKYITYRYEKERVRNTRHLTEKLTASNVQNQNANVDEFSFGGRIGETASYITKQYALDHLISRKTLHNHNNNEVYIHDLDAYAVGSHNCLSIPFDKLLAEGFSTRQGDVRQAGSVNTAFQLVAVIFQLQSLQQFGGVAAPHLDWTMVPYVRKSFWKHFKDGLKYIEKWTDEELDAKFCNMETNFGGLSIEKTEILSLSEDGSAVDYAYDKTEQELEQAVEGLYHNLNTLNLGSLTK